MTKKIDIYDGSPWTEMGLERLKRVANFGQDAEYDTKGEIIHATIYHLAR